jgi:hypothetical protein
MIAEIALKRVGRPGYRSDLRSVLLGTNQFLFTITVPDQVEPARRAARERADPLSPDNRLRYERAPLATVGVQLGWLMFVLVAQSRLKGMETEITSIQET